MSQKTTVKIIFNLVMIITLLALSASLAFAQSGDQDTGTGQAVNPGEGTETDQLLACSETYVVQSGDSLSLIASQFYDDPLAFDIIYEATNAAVGTEESFTRIDDPNLITPGQTLCIPAGPEAATGASDAVAGMTDAVAAPEAMTPVTEPKDDQQMSEEGTLIVENFTGRDMIFDLTEPTPDSTWVGPDETQEFTLTPGVYSYQGHHLSGDPPGIIPGEVEVSVGEVVQLACFADSRCQLVPGQQQQPGSQQQVSPVEPNDDSGATETP